MKIFLRVCLAALLVPTLLGQEQQAKDPVSGMWGDPDGPGFELKFDGKHSVSGTIRIVSPGGRSTAPVKTGTYDTGTGMLKLQGDAKGPDGVEAPFTVEGTLEKDTITGTYQFGDTAKGDFTFTRVKQ
jgi:hypothetical protein